MPTPPYAYGGGTYGSIYGQPPTYRDALLDEMDPNAWRYGTPQMIRPGTGVGSTVVNAAGALAPTVARQVAASTAPRTAGLVGALSSSGRAAPIGGATSAGVGLATELVGSALKPKVQAPTASPYADITDQYGRRMEGSGEGIAGGATKWGGRGFQVGGAVGGPVGAAVGAGIGALGGAIGGALTKNAASAYSDFSRADAVKAIQEMFRTRGGREATPADIEAALAGQGSTRGGQWIGEQGLYTVLNNLDRNFAAERAADPTAQAAQAYAARHGLPNPQVVPGAATAGAGAGAGAPPADTSQFNTDGYAVPQVVARATGPPPPGWDAKKWADPNHQTPKYAVGRIVAQYPPSDAGWQQATAEIQKAYPGTTIIGNDKVNIPGVGVVDIRKGADAGGQGWQFNVEGAGGGGGGAAAAGMGGGGATSSAAGGVLGAAGLDRGTIAQIIEQIRGITGNRAVPTSRRESVLELLRR